MNTKPYDACDKLLKRAIKERWGFHPACREVFSNAAKGAPVILKCTRALPLDVDVQHIADWLGMCLLKEPPPPSIKAFWFGLFEDADAGWMLYIAGSKRYSRVGVLDWAVSPAWFPSRRHCTSTVLARLSRAQPRRDYETALRMEYCCIYPFAVLAIAEALRRLDPALLLGRAAKRAAACGFDDGDFLHLGEITPKGFQPRPSP